MIFNCIKTALIPRWLVGISAYSIFNCFFDYVLSSWLIWKFGSLSGGVVFALLGFLLDLGTLKIYDLVRTDWLALEYLKSLRRYFGRSWSKRAMAYLLTSTPTIAQFFFYPSNLILLSLLSSCDLLMSTTMLL